MEVGRPAGAGLATPGHSDDGLAFVIGDGLVATGDTLFRDAVGGGDVEQCDAR